jgi:hypothetical protein
MRKAVVCEHFPGRQHALRPRSRVAPASNVSYLLPDYVTLNPVRNREILESRIALYEDDHDFESRLEPVLRSTWARPTTVRRRKEPI